ncbi:Putative ribonuclease H protein At1g65750, partial [Linum grandiflorum]
TFAANFCLYSITRAELRGAIHGLILVWDKSFWKVHLQMDSSCALAFLLGNPPDDAGYSSCIREARQFLNCNWEVSTSHIYREDNIVADLLIHYGHSLSFGLHALSSLSRNVLACARVDLDVIMFPRLIPINN